MEYLLDCELSDDAATEKTKTLSKTTQHQADQLSRQLPAGTAHPVRSYAMRCQLELARGRVFSVRE